MRVPAPAAAPGYRDGKEKREKKNPNRVSVLSLLDFLFRLLESDLGGFSWSSPSDPDPFGASGYIEFRLGGDRGDKELTAGSSESGLVLRSACHFTLQRLQVTASYILSRFCNCRRWEGQVECVYSALTLNHSPFLCLQEDCATSQLDFWVGVLLLSGPVGQEPGRN